jgi:hypothetical protein
MSSPSNYPAAKQLARVLRQQSPPTQANPITSVLPGNLILDGASVIAVNNTAATIGKGATALAPFTCQIKYQNSMYYGVPWFGSPPVVGVQAAVLSQPPLMFVLGTPSNIANG